MAEVKDELKERILRAEQSLGTEPRKLSIEEIRAELQGALDSEVDAYIADNLRQQRLAETTTKARRKSDD